MKTNIFLRIGALCTLALSGAVGVMAQHEDHIPAKDAKDAGRMMADCKDMMAQKQKIKADVKAQDSQLALELGRMNRAPSDKKVDLMATLLTRMVEQRLSMDARKEKMEEEMMQHMMRHMSMEKGAMADCPMMKKMAAK
jgi:hypothetical protein